MGSKTLLIVDDNDALLKSYELYLKRKGYTTLSYTNGKDAIDRFTNDKDIIDVVIVDLRMQGMSGIEVLKHIKAMSPETKVMIMTAYSDEDSAIEALRLRADDYLQKPFEFGELEFRILKCLEDAESQRRMKSYETLLPICCVCKKIRDDEGKERGAGTWFKLETFLEKNTELHMSHTYCPECSREYYDELEAYKKQRNIQ